MARWLRRGRTRGNTRGEYALVDIPVNGGLVSGQVRDVSGKPLSNADIAVTNSLGHTVLRSETDTFGSFVAALNPGSYQINAHFGGYQGMRRVAEVRPGDHVALGDLVLEPSDTVVLPQRGVWQIDPAHSSVRFVARHLALSRIHGEFTRFAGEIEISPRIEDCTAEVVIDAASIDTSNPERDAHLRSADFLDVERNPRIHFTSTRFAHLRGDRWRVDGALTMHGITSDVRLDTVYLGTRNWNGLRAGITATTELHRAHYTLNWQQMLSHGIAVVGSTIEIVLDVQAVHGTAAAAS